MAFDAPAMLSLLLKVVGSLVIPYLLFRSWAFTIRPFLYPQEPKELPYWIPYLGHAIEFVKNGQKVITRGRLYFGNTREPFALTLGGEKLYFLTSPDDVTTLYKNTTALNFEKIVHELTVTFGVSKKTVDKTFEQPSSHEDDAVSHALDIQNPKLKSLSDINLDLWKQQLVPGPKYYELQTLFARYLDESLHPKGRKFQGPGLETSSASGKHTASVLLWTQRVLIDAALRVFFGDVLVETEPQIMEDFLAFDDDNWKLWYKWPQADDMFAAKSKVAAALQRYVALPEARREDASFIVKSFIKAQRAIGTSDEDLSNILSMLVWVTNTNTYKVCFWAIAHMMQDEQLLTNVKEEISHGFNEDGSVNLQYLADSCPWLSALFHEALRFCSASSSIRLVTEPFIIGSKKLPKGARVMVPFRQMHFDERIYDQPNAFNPERFVLNKKLASSTSYRPFGGGISYCPGRFIAKQEVCTFIALLFRNFHVSIDPNQKLPELDDGKPTTGLMSPKEGEDMLLRLQER